MHASAAKGQSKAVQWLLQHGVDVNTQTMLGDTPLMVSVMGGHKDTVQHLMENGSNVRLCNMDKDTALHKAVAEVIPNFENPMPIHARSVSAGLGLGFCC